MASVTTYHCLCTEFVLATTAPLAQLPTRQADRASICPLMMMTTTTSGTTTTTTPPETLRPGAGILTESVRVEPQALVLKLADGFEKRYLAKCARCGLTLGYQLDRAQFEATQAQVGARQDVLYLLPGGLLTTEEMSEGAKGAGGARVGVATRSGS